MICEDSIQGVNVEGQDVIDVVEMVKVLSDYIFQLVDTLVICIISTIENCFHKNTFNTETELCNKTRLFKCLSRGEGDFVALFTSASAAS